MEKTVIIHDAQVYANVPDYEQYAYVYSKTLSSEVFADVDMAIDQYVMIGYQGKKIYRKCAARCGVKSDEISLGNRSIRELGLKRTELNGVAKVQMSRCNWFQYQFNNSDSSLKASFVIVLIGLMCSIFSTIKDLVEILCDIM